VKIYEYTPGFIHAKNVVSDDKVALVGTINLDYRSFYFHFECGVAFYKSSVVSRIKKDLDDTIMVSREITLSRAKSVSLPQRLVRAVLRLFAPIM
ncbi:MAG: phospholipase D-like domain-containing protein, partial [Clostridiales bacterium]